MKNNATCYDDEPIKGHVAINSIQREVYVKRLVIRKRIYKDIYSYDQDNLYPQKVISIAERSWALSTALKTFSDFIRGDGFENEDLMSLVVNSEGETLFDILKDIANQKNKFGFALHFNYNVAGQITEINKVNFEDFRVMTDGRLKWCADWSDDTEIRLNSEIYERFNPDTASNELKEAGLKNYNGQILYWTGCNNIYPLCTFDASLDAGQYQAESELYKLSNIENGFSLSGVWAYPQMMKDDKEVKEIKKAIKGDATGGANAGRVMTVGIPTSVYEGGAKAIQSFETFERSNIDNLFTQQNKEAREAIFSIFRQPAILNAISESGMFNQQSLQDAFTFYNSIVEEDRKDVERILEKILMFSIWGEQEVRIKPKMLIVNEGDGIKDDGENTNNDS